MSPTYASPADETVHGQYTFVRDERGVYRFANRLGSAEHPAEAGRYHLYHGWFCPWAHRATLTVTLAGLNDVLSTSAVHGERDGRGWAFREPTGADPVNGFTLLREAYEASEPGYDGHVSVPVLWDRITGTIVSNTFGALEIDLATAFGARATALDLYPGPLRARIDELEAWLLPAVNQGLGTREALPELDRILRDSTFLAGEDLTLADVRLWVTLVRQDAGLDSYPALWDWARALYARPAFAATTRFSSFGSSPTLDWTAPTERSAA